MEELDNILAKYFSGEATPSETVTVEQWKLENEEEFALLSDSWNSLEIPEFEDIKETKTYDHARAWQKVDAQLVDQEDFEKKTKVIRLNFYKRVAAACAILLVGLTGFWFINQNGIASVSNEANAPKEIILPDGSQIWLAANATMDYSKDFANDRSITLDGEAFFEVARDEEHPFVITTKMGEIEVLGTAFNVNSNEIETTVSVDHGKVELRNDAGKQYLTASEEATATAGGISMISSTDPNFKSWSTGDFKFKETAISDIVDALNKHYEKQIIIETEALGKEVISDANFPKMTVLEAAHNISRLSGAEVIEEATVIRLK